MSKVIVGILVLFLSCAVAPAQDHATAAAPMATPNSEERLRLAVSVGSYPVTPGDVYRLSFQQGNTPSTLDIVVGSSYTIQLNVFGTVNAMGMTFAQVKQTVEKAFAAAFPRSVPSLAISSVGIFPVFLRGETPEARNVDSWGLSRLSDVLEGRLGPYSCLRNITVISADGTEREYDLFQYWREGLADQNPYLKAGDTVVLAQSERTVGIAGEVKRPGRYQLLASDGIREVIDSYGGGMTTSAEPSRTRIDRVSGDKASTVYVDGRGTSDPGILLEDSDLITIPSKIATLPVVYFEGAVTSEATSTTPTAQATQPATGLFTPVTYNRLSYRFRSGETLRSAVVALRDSISPMANLSAAFLLREGAGDSVTLDLAALLAGAPSSSDIPLSPMDRIVIPSAQYFVAVYGEVTRPGNYPFAPSRTYRYYADLAGFGDIDEIPQNIVVLDSGGSRRALKDIIEPGSRIYLTAARVTVQGAVLNPGNFAYRRDFSELDYENLAGGFDPEKSTNSKIIVFDSTGKPRKPLENIQPGDRIYVEADQFGFNFGRGLPIFLSVLTAVSSIVTMYALLR
jgi:polysaccharide biosynthesis/export protein